MLGHQGVGLDYLAQLVDMKRVQTPQGQKLHRFDEGWVLRSQKDQALEDL